jgi:flagella basal body P-ring formation protein FlgA
MPCIRIPILLAACLFCGSAAAAVQTLPLEQIRAAVHAFITAELDGKDAELEVGRLDQRLRLPACNEPLDVSRPAGQRVGNTTVSVRCPGTQPWTLYVPVTVNLYETVLSAAGTLARGSTLKVADLAPIRRNIATLAYGYYLRPEDVIGMELRRTLRPGEILTPANIKAPALVASGDQVLLVADTGGVRVAMKGEALQEGAAGERVQVRNLSSRRVVEGEVVGRGLVKVTL